MLPYALIIVSVLAYAIFPLVIASIPTGQIPTPVFLLTLSVIGAIVLVVSSGFLFVQSGATTGIRRAVRLALRREALGLGFINAVLNNMGYAFLYLAIQSGLILTGAVLYELWTTVFLLASWWLREDKHGAFVARQGGPTTLVFFFVGMFGLLIVAYAGAQSHGTQSGLAGSSGFQSSDWLGLTLAILAPIAMGISFVFGTENGQRIAARLEDETDIDESRARVIGGAVSSMLLRLFSMLIQSVLLLVLVLADAVSLPNFSPLSDVWPPLLACGFLVAIGGSFATIGNTLSTKANLNLLYYFVPFLTLIALWVFGFIATIGSLAFFGCILVLAANYVLTATYGHSLAFRFAIAGTCLASALVLYTPGNGVALRIDLVAILLGLFGLLAAFLIDRIGRDGDRLFGPEQQASAAMTSRRSKALESYGQNVFVLWTLAFGSLALMFIFRTGSDMMYDFFAVVTAVAILYLALLPVDLMERFSPMWRTRQADREMLGYEQLVLSLLVSVLFLFALLALLLLALQMRQVTP